MSLLPASTRIGRELKLGHILRDTRSDCGEDGTELRVGLRGVAGFKQITCIGVYWFERFFFGGGGLFETSIPKPRIRALSFCHGADAFLKAQRAGELV